MGGEIAAAFLIDAYGKRLKNHEKGRKNGVFRSFWLRKRAKTRKNAQKTRRNAPQDAHCANADGGEYFAKR